MRRSRRSASKDLKTPANPNWVALYKSKHSLLLHPWLCPGPPTHSLFPSSQFLLHLCFCCLSHLFSIHFFLNSSLVLLLLFSSFSFKFDLIIIWNDTDIFLRIIWCRMKGMKVWRLIESKWKEMARYLVSLFISGNFNFLFHIFAQGLVLDTVYF